MATSKVDIYSRAINEFDDPRITSAYKRNPIEFFEIMDGYLNNAIPTFVTPTIMLSVLNDVTVSSTQIELFDGDGITDTFTLTTTPPDGSYFYAYSGNVNFNTPYDVTYDELLNQVVLSGIPPTGVENVYVQWYFAGQFNQTLLEREEVILARLTVKTWATKEKNFLLDIRRLLNDTDFRLAAESTNMNSKGTWFAGIREQCEMDMNQYSWDVYNNNLRKQYGLPEIGGVR